MTTVPRISLHAWTALWHELQAAGDSAEWHARLLALWSEPARRYHNRRHLEECPGGAGSQSSARFPPRVGGSGDLIS